MIVSISIGEDVDIMLDDAIESYSPTRTSELCDQAAQLLADTLAACKASRSRTVKAKDS